MYERKINCITLNNWSHHFGGWNYIVDAIYQHLHCEDGIPFYTNGIFGQIKCGRQLIEPWIGVCHFAMEEVKETNFLEKNWRKSIEKCKGIYVHSSIIQQHLKNILNVDVNFIWHATPVPAKEFDFNVFLKRKRIISVGRWLRRWDRFQLLKKTFEINCLDENNYVGPVEYEDILASSLIFVDMHDSSCNNTIIECLVRNTPLLICKLPTVVEYLGNNYPMYFENMEEMNQKAFDLDLILECHNYLKSLDKNKFTREAYLDSFYSSSIYRNIK